MLSTRRMTGTPHRDGAAETALVIGAAPDIGRAARVIIGVSFQQGTNG